MDQVVAWFQVKEQYWGLGLVFEAEEPGLSSWSSLEESPVRALYINQLKGSQFKKVKGCHNKIYLVGPRHYPTSRPRFFLATVWGAGSWSGWCSIWVLSSHSHLWPFPRFTWLSSWWGA